MEASATGGQSAPPEAVRARAVQVFRIFSEEKMLICPKIMGRLCQSSSPYDDALKLREFLKGRGLFIADERDFSLWEASFGLGKVAPIPLAAQPGEWAPRAASVKADLAVSLEGTDVTDKSRCRGTVRDFVGYFSDRFDRLSGQLKLITFGSRFAKVREAADSRGKTATVIGMIYSKKTTKNGHLLFEVEDKESMAPVLVPKDSPFLSPAQNLLEDEVVAFEVYSSNSLLIAKSFNVPGKVVQQRKRRLSNTKAKIAFISDLHVGSKWFLQEEFRQFLQFLNGKATEEEREIARDIKYLSIGGDLVDGIGVYPNQERELVTKDIFTQYEILCEFLKAIPEHIETIIIPGNHDAVRVAEPQPAIPIDFLKAVGNRENLHFAGNPSMHRVEGLTLLAYHGTSADSWVSSLSSLRDGYENPQKVAAEMLNCRHLCPKYGEDPVVPEARDYMALDYFPDIFHLGHVHKNGYFEDYFGTTIINSGTFQAQTGYQVSMGHLPTPCKVPVYSLDTGKLEILDFSREGRHA
jgi:DNA polymerase II small subunit